MRLTKQSSCPAPSVAGDAGGAVTGNETFITVNDESATLPNSRQITAGTNISIVDGGSGNPITINCTLTVPTKVEIDQFIRARDFVPSQSTLSPAPVVQVAMSTGRTFHAVKYVAGSETEAGAIHWNRWITKSAPGNPFADVLWYCDNADTSNVTFDLSVYQGSFPAGDYNTAIAWLGAVSVAPGGQYKMVRTTFNCGAVNGNVWQFILRRRGDLDSNTGTVYMTGIGLYEGVLLS